MLIKLYCVFINFFLADGQPLPDDVVDMGDGNLLFQVVARVTSVNIYHKESNVIYTFVNLVNISR